MENSTQPDPYVAVLADLHAQRDRIDQAIAVLTALRGGTGAPAPVAAGSGQPSAIVETAGMYLGMSIPEATKKLLNSRKQTMANSEIASALQGGGLVMTSNDPANTIGSVLTRRFKDVGDIAKVGRGIWGLKEWYPGRNFKHTPQPRSPNKGTHEAADLSEEVADSYEDMLGLGEEADSA